jgi:pyruvate/2-oxoglutarate dehydrogenase complex dihydrolipoamide dehydrogenase (E3) component
LNDLILVFFVVGFVFIFLINFLFVNGGGKSGHSAAQKLAIFPVLITDAGVDQRLGGCAHHIACIRQGALARQGQSVDARVIY